VPSEAGDDWLSVHERPMRNRAARGSPSTIKCPRLQVTIRNERALAPARLLKSSPALSRYPRRSSGG
jgi:hypothetical protein